MSAEKPIIKSNLRALDFGAGFYLTSSEVQAVKWAQSMTRFTKEIAVQLLFPQNLTDQYAFLTDEAITFLDFERSDIVCE